MRGNFDDFLASRKPGEPWHYFFGPTTTHRKWVKGSGKLLWGIKPDSLKGELPKFLPDVPEDVADYTRRRRTVRSASTASARSDLSCRRRREESHFKIEIQT